VHGIERQPRRDTVRRDDLRAEKEAAFEQFGPVVLDLLADGPIQKKELAAALQERGLKRSWCHARLNVLQARRVIKPCSKTRNGSKCLYWSLLDGA
jgi:hypothetical protein